MTKENTDEGIIDKHYDYVGSWVHCSEQKPGFEYNNHPARVLSPGRVALSGKGKALYGPN